MFGAIFNDLRREYQYGNMVTRLVIVNVFIFIAIQVFRLILLISQGGQVSPLFDDFLRFISLSSDWKFILTHPWVLITAHFVHVGFWHLLFNMFALYWFGRIVGDFIGNHRILPLYFLGGLFGSVFFYLSTQILPSHNGIIIAYGASAAVMAMVTASGTVSPDYSMRFMFIGTVKLKYVVIALLVLDLIGISNNENTGGHFGHLGGAFFGWFYVWSLRQGRDMAKPFTKMYLYFKSVFFVKKTPKQRPSPRLVYKKSSGNVEERWYESTPDLPDFEDHLDAILAKIKISGYASLNQKEKDFLQEASKK